MKPEYEPKTFGAVLGYLVEECGEVLAATGKAQRWGLESRNPELQSSCRECGLVPILEEDKGVLHTVHSRNHGLPTHAYADSRETNREWILREMDDLERAIKRLREWLR